MIGRREEQDSGGGGGGDQDSGRRGPGTPEPPKMQILNSERLKEGKD